MINLRGNRYTKSNEKIYPTRFLKNQYYSNKSALIKLTILIVLKPIILFQEEKCQNDLLGFASIVWAGNIKTLFLYMLSLK